MSADPLRRMRVEIHGITQQYKGFFELLEYDTSHELYSGGMRRKNWLVFQRGDSVAVILYKKDTEEVILTRQFRAPTLKVRQADGAYVALGDGQLDEIIAGIPQPGESYEDCIAREIYEEAGYLVRQDSLVPIAKFYVSPGGTSERIYLYYAEVTDADRAAGSDQQIAGVENDGESILVRHIPVSELFADIVNPDKVVDGKVLIASLLIKERLRAQPVSENQIAPKGRHAFAIKGSPGCSLILRTGNMMSIDDVDAWINSENTDMEMDRFIGNSVSAQIRYWGAAKDEQGRVIEDTIADALRRRVGPRHTSNIGTVHDTTPGELGKKNVKRIFHVAAVKGVIGKGLQADPRDIELVTRKALEAVERRNGTYWRKQCTSALLPMIGTGEVGLGPEIAFPEIVKGVLTFFENQKNPVLKAVHICAFRQRDANFALSHLRAHADLSAELPSAVPR